MRTENKVRRGFSGPLMLEDLGMVDGVPLFKTLAELRYVDLDGGLDLIVPKGSVTDFASVPWVLRWIVPRMGRYNPATVLHDELCRRKLCSRFMADAILRDSMAGLKVPLWRRVLMFYGVRAYAVLTGKE